MTATAVSPAEAARLVASGFPFVPLWACENGRCLCPLGHACESPGKHPHPDLAPRGKDSAMSDPAAAASACNEQRVNAGTALEPAGLVVVDVDAHSGRANGHLELAKLERTLGPLPETVETASGGGGRHVWFRHPGGELRKALAPGVELLVRGLVVVPPSVHASGRRYEWVRDPWKHDVVEFPARWHRYAGRASQGSSGSGVAVAFDSIPASVEVRDEQLLRLLDTPGPGGDVSSGDFAVAARAARVGYDDRAIAALVADHRERAGDPKRKAGRLDYLIATVSAARAAVESERASAA